MRALFRDESGSSLPIHAVMLAIGTILLGGVLNSGLVYLEDRRLQGLTDLIALMSVRDQDYSAEFALRIIEDQGRDPALFDPVLVPGRYVANPDLPPPDRFSPGRRGYNAVRVSLHAATEDETERGRLLATAAAAREDRISFSVGSRLVRVEGGYSGILLQRLLGLDTALTIADYNALAGIRIDSDRFITELRDISGTLTGRFDQLVALNLPPDSIIEAVVRSASDAEQPILRAVSRSVRLPADRIGLDEVVRFDPELAGVLNRGGASVRLSALDLIAASALAAQEGRQLGLAVNSRAADIALSVGEAPRSPSLDSTGRTGSRAETRQVGLDVETQGLTRLRLRLEAAQTDAEVVRVRCSGRREVEADFLVTTTPARLVLQGRGLLSNDVVVDLGTRDRQRVRMTHRDIESGTPRTVSSGTGLNADLPGLSLALTPIVREIADLLDDAGIHLGEVDLFLRDASCGHAFLVE